MKISEFYAYYEDRYCPSQMTKPLSIVQGRGDAASENSEKFAATREYEKGESKFMTGVDYTFSSEVLTTPS